MADKAAAAKEVQDTDDLRSLSSLSSLPPSKGAWAQAPRCAPTVLSSHIDKIESHPQCQVACYLSFLKHPVHTT